MGKYNLKISVLFLNVTVFYFSFVHRFFYIRVILANTSLLTEFTFTGLMDQPDLQIPLFFLFLLMHVVTALGNLGLISLIVLNSHIHSPMYLFLFNLSLKDFSYSSVVTPKCWWASYEVRMLSLTWSVWCKSTLFVFYHFWMLCADLNGLCLLFGYLQTTFV